MLTGVAQMMSSGIFQKNNVFRFGCNITILTIIASSKHIMRTWLKVPTLTSPSIIVTTNLNKNICSKLHWHPRAITVYTTNCVFISMCTFDCLPCHIFFVHIAVSHATFFCAGRLEKILSRVLCSSCDLFVMTFEPAHLQ